MTREEYRKLNHLNFSLAKLLLDSPAHFRAGVDEEQEETEAMMVGEIAHSLILEGKGFLDLYAIKPKGMSFATTEGKLWKAKQTKKILKEEDSNSIPRMAEAISKNPTAATILKGCQQRETPILFTYQDLACKCLLDAHGTDGNAWAITDLKTAADASPRGFAKAVVERHLDMQCAWYQCGLAQLHGLEAPPWFAWIVVEKKAPFVNVVYEPDPDTLESGRRKMERAIEIYQDCMASGEWPMPYQSPDNKPLKLTMPDWAKRS